MNCGRPNFIILHLEDYSHYSDITIHLPTPNSIIIARIIEMVFKLIIGKDLLIAVTFRMVRRSLESFSSCY